MYFNVNETVVCVFVRVSHCGILPAPLAAVSPASVPLRWFYFDDWDTMNSQNKTIFMIWQYKGQ